MFQISHSVMNEETLGWGIKWRAEKEEGIMKKKKRAKAVFPSIYWFVLRAVD